MMPKNRMPDMSKVRTAGRTLRLVTAHADTRSRRHGDLEHDGDQHNPGISPAA